MRVQLLVTVTALAVTATAASAYTRHHHRHHAHVPNVAQALADPRVTKSLATLKIPLGRQSDFTRVAMLSYVSRCKV